MVIISFTNELYMFNSVIVSVVKEEKEEKILNDLPVELKMKRIQMFLRKS
jgi:hypothetical protein